MNFGLFTLIALLFLSACRGPKESAAAGRPNADQAEIITADEVYTTKPRRVTRVLWECTKIEMGLEYVSLHIKDETEVVIKAGSEEIPDHIFRARPSEEGSSTWFVLRVSAMKKKIPILPPEADPHTPRPDWPLVEHVVGWTICPEPFTPTPTTPLVGIDH